MGKNIVVCLDGTGNDVKAENPSNVFKLAEALELRDPAKQILYYDPGVGTIAAPGAWGAAAPIVSRTAGLAIGNGMRQNLGEAYTYLMKVWEPGDRIFLIGFSRGAYTARALAGMVFRIGLLRPGSENLVPYAVKVYARRRGKDSDLSGDEGWKRLDRFSAALSRNIEGSSRALQIDFLGLWDTVKAANVMGRDLKWPYTRQLPNVRVLRHAVSIDEKRRPYAEYLVGTPADGQRWIETWFAGVHSDVGGAFANDPELGNITLRWMLDAAVREGLVIRPQLVRARYSLSSTDATASIHRMGSIWALATFRRRVLPRGSRVHASVRDRVRRFATNVRGAHPHRCGVGRGLVADGHRMNRWRARMAWLVILEPANPIEAQRKWRFRARLLSQLHSRDFHSRGTLEASTSVPYFVRTAGEILARARIDSKHQNLAENNTQ